MTDKERIAELEAELARLRGAIRDHCREASFDVEAFGDSLRDALWDSIKTAGLFLIGFAVAQCFWAWWLR